MDLCEYLLHWKEQHPSSDSDSFHVTEIREDQHGKSLLILNGAIYCSLYNKEFHRLHICEGDLLSVGFLGEMSEKLLIPRAREYALYLLDGKDYTEKQLKRKLIDHHYSDEISRKVLDDLKQMNLVDDRRYAQTYLEQKSGKRSFRDMKEKLSLRGIDPAVTTEVWYEMREDPDEENDPEKAALESCFEKKAKALNFDNPKDRDRMVRYLLGKGFEYSAIRKVMREKTLSDTN